jgi:hypothetical protein
VNQPNKGWRKRDSLLAIVRPNTASIDRLMSSVKKKKKNEGKEITRTAYT